MLRSGLPHPAGHKTFYDLDRKPVSQAFCGLQRHRREWSSLMQILHGGSAEDDEESHPQGCTLERDDLVRLFLVGVIIGPKDDGVQKQGEQTQHQEQLNHEHHEVFGVVLHAGAGLGDQDLIDVVEIDASGEQENDQENAGHFLVVPIKNVGDRFDLFLWNGFLQSRGDRHHKKSQATDPNDRRKQMKPVIDDRNQDVEISRNGLERVHGLSTER